MKIEIKNRYNKSILFSYECENNTILKTLLEGIKQGAVYMKIFVINLKMNIVN
jgi:hypothetical protein